MKQQQWLLFLKYPYAAAVLVCIWVGSATMAFIDRSLPVLTIIVINTLVSWVITWLSFRPSSSK